MGKTAQALIDDRISIGKLKDSDLKKMSKEQRIKALRQQHLEQSKLELTRISKQRQLVESVNPFTIFETDSGAEGSVMGSIV